MKIKRNSSVKSKFTERWLHPNLSNFWYIVSTIEILQQSFSLSPTKNSFPGFKFYEIIELSSDFPIPTTTIILTLQKRYSIRFPHSIRLTTLRFTISRIFIFNVEITSKNKIMKNVLKPRITQYAFWIHRWRVDTEYISNKEGRDAMWFPTG